MNNRILLGVDYGLRRIGIAICYTESGFTFPRKPIDIRNENPIDIILATIEKENIDAIVIGYPVKFDGSLSENCILIDQFIIALSTKTQIPIYKQNEAYSTVSAKDRTKHYTTKQKKKSKARIDSAAAAIILEEYLKTIS